MRGALFFALAHVVTLFDASTSRAGAQRALFSFVALLPVAVTLGWLFLARRSLYAAIGLHAAFNAIQVLAAGDGCGGCRRLIPARAPPAKSRAKPRVSAAVRRGP